MDTKKLFQTKELYIGSNARKELALIMDQNKFTRILIVSDQNLTKTGAAELVMNSLEISSLSCNLFDQIEKNPSIENVLSCLEALIDFKADCIVALGGGSVIDASKAAALAYTNEDRRDMVSMEGINKCKKPGLPLIAMPTTCGTGSETTMDYVITNKLANRKMACLDKYALPLAAIIDLDILSQLPVRLIAATAADALTHAIEAYTTITAWEMTRMLAASAVKLVFTSLKKAIASPGEQKYLHDLAIAQYQAGVSFTNTGLGLSHAIAHPLSAHFDIHHGLANAIALIPVMRFNQEVCANDYSELAAASGLSRNISKNGADIFINAVDQLLTECSLPRTLFQIPDFNDEKIALADCNLLTADALNDICISDNPRLPEHKDIYQIYRALCTKQG
jgi:lactaldehyde reductase